MAQTTVRVDTNDYKHLKKIAAEAGISTTEQLHRLIRADRLAGLRVEAERLSAIAEETGDAEQWRIEDQARLGSAQ